MILLALAWPASAAAAETESSRASSTVLLTVAATSSEAAELEAVARELLGRLELRVELRRVERLDTGELRRPSQAYFARVWIAIAAGGKARLYLEHSARDRLLLRDVNGDAQNPELLREELGHILQTALEGLKAGEEIGAPRKEALAEVEPPQRAPATAPAAARNATTPKAVTPTPRARPLRFGPRYEVIFLGDHGLFEDGPGAVLGLLVPGSQRLGVELMATYHRPLHVEQGAIGARLQSWVLGAGLSYETWRAERSSLRLGVAVSADLVKVTPFSSRSDDVEIASSDWRRLALGRVTTTYSYRAVSFMTLELGLGVELDPSGTRYVLETTSGEQDVLAPWPVRPLLTLGVGVP